MNVFKTCVLLLSICCLGACKNDIEINAPWQEIPVVYGLLDVNQTTQYIRVQKAYQNAINLTTAEGAQIGDSLFFKDITVKVRNSYSESILTKVDTFSKESGFFASDANFLYRANMSLDPAQTYTLEITSNETGKKYTAQTQLVGKSNISIAANYKFYIRPYLDFNRINFPFQPASNGSVFDILIRFKYKEYPTGNPSAFVEKNIDYLLEKNITSVPASGKTYNPYTRDWIFYIKSNLVANGAVRRELIQVDYVVIAGSKELKDIIDLSKPSAVIVQRKKDYSNINGGLGIFSSRSETVRSNVPFQDDSSKIYLIKDLPNFIY
ncbi:MAG: hypothetical protein V4651_09995 [Bacteroidota bacterium]